MKKFVLMRHGESQWNLENRFTGWTDVDLTEKGEAEAENCGLLLREAGFQFDIVHTSLLKRANRTMEICLHEMGLSGISIKYNWRLNERHYGALQGLNKAETAAEYGDKYSSIQSDILPDSECLKDTVDRFMPYWLDSIKPDIESGHSVLIVAHGNSLRALVKYLDKVSDDDIVELNIPTGVPLVYELDDAMNPVKSYYLGDQEEISKRTAEVAAQGKNRSI